MMASAALSPLSGDYSWVYFMLEYHYNSDSINKNNRETRNISLPQAIGSRAAMPHHTSQQLLSQHPMILALLGSSRALSGPASGGASPSCCQTVTTETEQPPSLSSALENLKVYTKHTNLKTKIFVTLLQCCSENKKRLCFNKTVVYKKKLV